MRSQISKDFSLKSKLRELAHGGEVQGPGGPSDDKAGIFALSNKEYVLPEDTVEALGKENLDDAVEATHTFTPPVKRRDGVRGLANGGSPLDYVDEDGVRWANKPPVGQPPAAGAPIQQLSPRPGDIPYNSTAQKAAAMPTSGGPNYVSPDSPSAVDNAVRRAAEIKANSGSPADPALAERSALRADAMSKARLLQPSMPDPALAERSAARAGALDTANVSKAAATAVPAEQAKTGLRAIPGKVGDFLTSTATTSKALPEMGAARTALNTASGPMGLGAMARGMGAGTMLAGAIQSNADLKDGYRDKFLESTGLDSSPLAATAGDVLRTASNIGDAATFGLAGRLGRGLSSLASGGGFGEGFSSDSPREELARTQMENTINDRAKQLAATTAPKATTLMDEAQNQAALRKPWQSDQSPAANVPADSPQSRRLSEMGVSTGAQNATPAMDPMARRGSEFLRSGGTEDYQNLGSYGGNASIYGKATDPTRPGRINSFAGAGPAGEKEYGAAAEVQSALRNLGGTPGSTSKPVQADDSKAFATPGINIIGQTDRFDDLAKKVSGMYSAKGRGNLARQLVAIEGLRGQQQGRELDSQGNIRTNETARQNALLNAQVSGENTDKTTKAHLLGTLADIENTGQNNAAKVFEATQRRKAEMAKAGQDLEEKGYDRYRKAIGDMFTTVDKDGKPSVDTRQQEAFTSLVESSDPNAIKKLSTMGPAEQARVLQQFRKIHDMNNVRNQISSQNLVGGTTTTRPDMPVASRESEWNDVVNHDLPLGQYIKTNLPFTNRNVVQLESGQAVPYENYIATNGLRDLDKEQLVYDSLKKRSALR